MFFGYPIVQNVVMSFQEYTTSTFYSGEAPWVGLANYVTILSSYLFTTTLVNHRAVHDRVDHLPVRDRARAGAVLPAQLPARRVPARDVAARPWLIPLIASSAVWKWLLDQESGALNQSSACSASPPCPGWSIPRSRSWA
ncbi:hypothetical protein GCM10020220_007780 [Nonomuraea rubra]